MTGLEKEEGGPAPRLVPRRGMNLRTLRIKNLIQDDDSSKTFVMKRRKEDLRAEARDPPPESRGAGEPGVSSKLEPEQDAAAMHFSLRR